MTKDVTRSRETYISFVAYFVFIFAVTFLGPYHGWKYGLVFSVGLTVSLWLIMRFVRVPLGEPSQGEPSHSEPTATASHIAEAAAIRRRD
jgi:hypothetical protein